MKNFVNYYLNSFGFIFHQYSGHSLSGEPENVDDDVVVLERVLFAEVAVIFGVPEARSTHMKSAVSFLENNHVVQVLGSHLILTGPVVLKFWKVEKLALYAEAQ